MGRCARSGIRRRTRRCSWWGATGRDRLIPTAPRDPAAGRRRGAAHRDRGLPGPHRSDLEEKTEAMLRIDVITIFPELFEPFRRSRRARQRAASAGADRARGARPAALDEGPASQRGRHPLRRRARHGDEAGADGGGDRGARGREGAERAGRRCCCSRRRAAPFTQAASEGAGRSEQLVLVCGRYEGVDQRAIELAVDEEISIGDYVLVGRRGRRDGGDRGGVALRARGARQPGFDGERSRFEQGRLEGPQYTRPAEYRGLAVPEVLRSGDHAKIARWRADEARNERNASPGPPGATTGRRR